MDVLLDTNVFVWIISEDSRLSESARSVFLNDENRLLFSIAGLWEVFIKLRSGKLTVDTDDPATFFKSQLQENAVSILGITLEHAAATRDLPMIHQGLESLNRIQAFSHAHDSMARGRRNPFAQGSITAP